jgi:hypothetical protein
MVRHPIAKIPKVPQLVTLARIIHILRRKAGIAEQKETARIAAGRM